VTRSERQKEAKMHIKNVLDEYNVTAVDTLIGDIVPPDALMKTLTDRKIAGEQEKTYITQKTAQLTRQELEKQTAVAEMQKSLVQADLGVEISKKNANAAIESARGSGESVKIKAEADAFQREVNGKAEASATLAVGTATAEAYNLAIQAMGNNNFAQFKIIEEIGKNKVNIMPQVLITGGNNGGSGSPIDALLGLKVLENMDRLTEGNTIKIDEGKQ
jgi:regulator of protease activity HflC (stomatin/prohibitin superfamily)